MACGNLFLMVNGSGISIDNGTLMVNGSKISIIKATLTISYGWRIMTGSSSALLEENK